MNRKIVTVCSVCEGRGVAKIAVMVRLEDRSIDERPAGSRCLCPIGKGDAKVLRPRAHGKRFTAKEKSSNE